MLHMLATWRLDRMFLAGRTAGGVRAHLAGCERCRRRYERHLIAEAALPGGDRRAADRLWQEIAAVAAQPAEARAGRPWRWSAGLAVGSLAAGLLVLSVERERGDGFAPRGEVTAPARAPALHVFHADAAGAPRPVAGVVGASEGLLFAYSNPGAQYNHLMVFALDARRRVYWFYPPYERAGDDPAAVPIETQKGGVELGEEIRHPLAAGPLRLYALFLPQAERVLTIEAAVAARYAAVAGAPLPELPLGIPGAHQESFLFEVTP